MVNYVNNTQHTLYIPSTFQQILFLIVKFFVAMATRMTFCVFGSRAFRSPPITSLCVYFQCCIITVIREGDVTSVWRNSAVHAAITENARLLRVHVKTGWHAEGTQVVATRLLSAYLRKRLYDFRLKPSNAHESMTDVIWRLLSKCDERVDVVQFNVGRQVESLPRFSFRWFVIL